MGRTHLVGVGGAGMAGLARFLKEAGHHVSGSDIAPSEALDALGRIGVTTRLGHSREHIEDADAVVFSDAIPPDNVEVDEAKRRRIPVKRRAEFISRLAADNTSIYVAGSHGKSTTAAMIAHVLDCAGLSPSFLLGADLLGAERRSRKSEGRHFVVEACEAFGNIGFYEADLAVITNIDDEHVDHYGAQHSLDYAFHRFAARAGKAIVCADDTGVSRILPWLPGVTTFGLGADCDVAADPEPLPFEVRRNSQALGRIELPVPGNHNRRNALAAVAACLELNVPFETIRRALAAFPGVSQRFQELEPVRGIRIVDDFAHHPTEVDVTLKAARTLAGRGRVFALLQLPAHAANSASSRFAKALAVADRVSIFDASGRHDLAQAILGELRCMDVPAEVWAERGELVRGAAGHLAPGDVAVVLGEGGAAGLAWQLSASIENLTAGSARPAREAGPSRTASAEVRTFVDQFRASVARHANEPAVADPFGSLTYAELDQRTDAIAGALVRHQLAGKVVAAAVPKTNDLPLALLGAMKAGCTYLPIDLNVPADRARFMLQRAGAQVVIGSARDHLGVPSITLTELAGEPGEAAAPPRPDALAYICFTSGSTGYPKGVAVRHEALGRLVADITTRFELDSASRVLSNTSIGFDVCLAEVCGALASGGCLISVAPHPLIGDRLGSAIDSARITHLFATPTVLSSTTPSSSQRLTCVVAAGEACHEALVSAWATPDRRFFNAYGPTEATVYATAARCAPGEPVSIGTPLQHLKAHVLDDVHQPLEDGEIGELALSGPGLAQEYVGDDQETARRFLTTTEGRLYLTGDRVVRRDGQLFYLGRRDAQVKVHGVRIELEEVERAALRHPGVKDAVVCPVPERQGALACFYMAEEQGALNASELEAQLRAWLPPACVPEVFVEVDSFPLTATGKKDRRSLLRIHAPGRQIRFAEDYAPPRTEFEKRVAEVWKRRLKLDRDVGMFDHFAALGGDSLSGLEIILSLEEELSIELPPGYFGRITTVPEMAIRISDLAWLRDAPNSIGAGFKGTRTYRDMWEVSEHWPGRRLAGDGLIRTLAEDGEALPYQLYLCCQDFREFLSLADSLPPDFAVHAMRSGHLVIGADPDSARQLTEQYASEIAATADQGRLIIAGVCQGARIARLVADRLTRLGRPPSLLAVIESPPPEDYAGALALIYAEESFVNPFRDGELLETASPVPGRSVDFVPGDHSSACIEPAVRTLAHHLVRRAVLLPGAERPDAQPLRFTPETRGVRWRGWHDVERGAQPYVWSGPGASSEIELDLTIEGPVQVRIQITNTIAPDLPYTLTLRLNGQEVPYSVETTQDGRLVCADWTGSIGPLVVEIELDRTERPVALGLSADSRALGVAVAWAEIAPKSPEEQASGNGADHRPIILELYRGLLSRTPTDDEIAHWSKAFRRGMPGSVLCEVISYSDEFARRLLAGGSPYARLVSDASLIRSSGLFDPEYYVRQTGADETSHLDPALHYAKDGWKQGVDPGPLFGTRHYLDRYPELEGVNPLSHYLRYGMQEGRTAWSEAALASWQKPLHESAELSLAELGPSSRDWPKLSPGDPVQVFAHSRGHIVFLEFRKLLATALASLGLRASECDETSPRPGGGTLSIIVAPHDFFYLPGGPEAAMVDLTNCILLNSEQMQSLWLIRSMPLLMKAPLVLDLHLQTAASLKRLGVNARFLPLGFVKGYPLFEPIEDCSRELESLGVAGAAPAVEGDIESREIDVLWIGSHSGRRQRFLDDNRALFDQLKSVIRLVDIEGPLSADHPHGISSAGFAAMAQRSKILLNVHSFPAPYFEWQRIVHFGLMQGACVVTEPASRVPGLEPGKHYFEEALDDLPELVDWLVRSPSGRRRAQEVRLAGYAASREQFDLGRSLRELFHVT